MRRWGEECDDEDGKGYPNDTRLYEDMHANDIRRRKKLKNMRRPKSRKQPEVYSVVSCCVTIRPVVLFEPRKGRAVDNERVPRHPMMTKRLTGFLIIIGCEVWLWEGFMVVGWMGFSVRHALAQSVGRRERLTEVAYASVCTVPALFDNAFLSWEGWVFG